MSTPKIKVAFPVTEKQEKMLRDFCADKMDGQFYIALRQPITEDYELSLSMFSNKPDILIGIYSSSKKEIVSSVVVSDADMKKALDALDVKYIHALTRTNPVANKDLILAWIAFINSPEHQVFEVEPELDN